MSMYLVWVLVAWKPIHDNIWWCVGLHLSVIHTHVACLDRRNLRAALDLRLVGRSRAGVYTKDGDNANSL